MILLAVDTATPVVSVALWRDGAVVAASAEAAERRHGERLAPAIEAVLDRAGTRVADLEVLAVDVGPGLFTGLRVGMALVKGLAAARSLPVVAVTSLEALAWPWRDDPRLLLAAVDARRGEVFAELTDPAGPSAQPDRPSEQPTRRSEQPAGPSTQLTEPCETGPRTPVGSARAIPPGDLPALVASRPQPPAGVLAVGDGARRYADSLGGVELGPPSADHPDAGTWADLAAQRADAGQVVTAAEVAAVYLRGADVRIGWPERGSAS